MIRPAWKRVFDLVASFLAIVVLSPLILLISIAIVVDDGFPVFFIQKRVGRDGVVFPCIKFRTMVRNAANIGTGIWTSENDPRITRVGRKLRSFIDELPQLFNVFAGHMSIVGPRPSLIYQANRYDDYQQKKASSQAWNHRLGADKWQKQFVMAPKN